MSFSIRMGPNEHSMLCGLCGHRTRVERYVAIRYCPKCCRYLDPNSIEDMKRSMDDGHNKGEGGNDA